MKRIVAWTGLIIIVVAMFWYLRPLQDAFSLGMRYAELYDARYPGIGMAIFVGIAMAGALLGPVAAGPFVPSAVVLWGEGTTMALLFCGWLVGGIISYWVGYIGGAFILRHCFQSSTVLSFRRFMEKKEGWWALLMARLALPSELLGYGLGVFRYSFWRFILLTAIAEIPFVVITTYAGDAIITRNPVQFGILIAIGLVIVAVAWQGAKSIAQK